MRYHYHTICFASDKGKLRSGVAKLLTRQVPRPALEGVRASLDFDENAVLVAQSYLGHMSEDEYQSGQIKKPSIILQALLIALAAAALAGLVLMFR